MSFSIIVTLLACMAHKFVSSNSLTRKASAASCRANTVASVKCISLLMSCNISLTSWRNGSFQISFSGHLKLPDLMLCHCSWSESMMYFYSPSGWCPPLLWQLCNKMFGPITFSDYCLLCSSHFLITN